MEYIDQMNRTIRLENAPRRIVSLVPSQTELLYDLGCGDRVVGITKFCIHPDQWYRNKTRVGGTKQVNFERIKALNPDLIIANKEENTKEEIELLAKEYPVYISDIYNVGDAIEMIHSVGKLVYEEEKAIELASRIREDYSTWPKFSGRVLYFIWANPYMVVGKNTFIGNVLADLGFDNVLEDKDIRYIEITDAEIEALKPEYALLSSEPFPFKEKHIKGLNLLINGEALLVDGEMFSWYGSRMTKMKAYFEGLFDQLELLQTRKE